jgi:chemotaxis protein methyltransferase CheR
MSIVLREWRELHGGGEFSVDATDIDPASVLSAERGVFPVDAISKVTPRRQERWFLRSGRQVEIAPEIRRRVKFEVLDLTIAWDRSTPQYHLVFCRNLLIYLTSAEHQLFYDRLAKVIKPGGYLVLGRTEALLGHGRVHFNCVDTKNRLYQRIA